MHQRALFVRLTAVPSAPSGCTARPTLASHAPVMPRTMFTPISPTPGYTTVPETHMASCRRLHLHITGSAPPRDRP